MPHFFIDPRSIKGNFAKIGGSDARHISSVLRLQAGDWLMLSDGSGRRWRGEIVTSSPKDVLIRILALKKAAPSQRPIRLCQALVKHDKFEWIVQKSVELGCSEVAPFASERTVPKFKTGKIERWQKIAAEAAKQCGSPFVPNIGPIVTYENLIKDIARGNKKAFLFFEGEEKVPLSKASIDNSGPLNLIIGPEGGFAEQEVALAGSAGCEACGLGPLILRVETAAIAAIALVQYRLGYFENNNATTYHST